VWVHQLSEEYSSNDTQGCTNSSYIILVTQTLRKYDKWLDLSFLLLAVTLSFIIRIYRKLYIYIYKPIRFRMYCSTGIRMFTKHQWIIYIYNNKTLYKRIMVITKVKPFFCSGCENIQIHIKFIFLIKRWNFIETTIPASFGCYVVLGIFITLWHSALFPFNMTFSQDHSFSNNDLD